MRKLKRIVLWFRQDLRIHDNEALDYAIERCDEVIPIFVFDERLFFGKTSYGFPKTGKFRTKFIIESIEDLRKSFQKLGTNLVVRIGKPEEEVAKLTEQVQASWVFCNRERTHEEVAVQDELERNLWKFGVELHYFRGKMLYYTQDLPFPVSHCPDSFTHFRKEVERFVPIREPLPSPQRIAASTLEINYGKIPKLEDFDFGDFEMDERTAFPFKGGESHALERLNDFIWERDLLQNYKETRNGMIGEEYSSKLSPWLAMGCLSPKRVYAEIKQYERTSIKNKSTYQLFFELLLRDFFRLMGKKYKTLIFKKGGMKKDVHEDLVDDMHRFKVWKEARSGVPLIDANMRELNQTGFMSNRGRQNVASFLINDLKVNWQIGAEYFESMLVDYDICSNWGNWNFIAGLGNDKREDRYFNILLQAKRYDPTGEYVKLWIPELTEVPTSKIHRPDTLSSEEQKEVHVLLGADYPKAVINTKRWAH